jgi:hypothetical protein
VLKYGSVEATPKLPKPTATLAQAAIKLPPPKADEPATPGKP